jgi:hypothetical protein
LACCPIARDAIPKSRAAAFIHDGAIAADGPIQTSWPTKRCRCKSANCVCGKPPL